MADPGPSSSGQSPSLDVEIVRHAAIWERLAVSDGSLTRAAGAAFREAGADAGRPCEVTIVLTDDAEMLELNRRWRGKDNPTNVLSFPAGDVVEPEDAVRQLGDIVIAAETVAREAEAQGIAVSDHAAHLVVHGLLHLLGFDHEREDDAERMEALEVKVLARLGIADPYAEPRPAPRLTEVST